VVHVQGNLSARIDALADSVKLCDYSELPSCVRDSSDFTYWQAELDDPV
jgi:hypothetical protein